MNKTSQKILLAILIFGIGVLVNCSGDIDFPPPPDNFNYCVFDANQTCSSGSFTICSADGRLSNECPYNSFPSSSSSFNLPSSSFNLSSSSSILLNICGDEQYNPSTQRCGTNDAIETKCGNNWHNETNSNLRCENDIIETKCGEYWYNETEKKCYDNIVVVDKCGINPQSYNPDLYECKPHINDNGIFLKNPVSYHDEDYEAVLIGEQIWMARNLNYEVEGSKCYGNDEANCEIYGRLYNWAMAMDLDSYCNSNPCLDSIETKHQGICPSGWHLPDIEEIYSLINYIGDDGGMKLKATSGWEDSFGTDSYGFNALAGGRGHSTSDWFADQYRYAFWWSASQCINCDLGDYNFIYILRIGFIYMNISLSGNFSYYMDSIRCLKD